MWQDAGRLCPSHPRCRCKAAWWARRNTFGIEARLKRLCLPHALIPNVLQKPFGRNLAALLLPHRLPIDETADRRKLQALVADIAVERHLVRARAAFAFAGDEIDEVGFVAALPAIHELRRVAAKARLRVFRRDARHLLRRASYESSR